MQQYRAINAEHFHQWFVNLNSKTIKQSIKQNEEKSADLLGLKELKEQTKTLHIIMIIYYI